MEPMKLTNQDATMIPGTTWNGTESPTRYFEVGSVIEVMVYPKPLTGVAMESEVKEAKEVVGGAKLRCFHKLSVL